MHPARPLSHGLRRFGVHPRLIPSRSARDDTIDVDANARRIGEFAFGTNVGIDRFAKCLLFDEKFGGTCHVALGGGCPETGSANVSPVRWDMVCDLRRGGSVDVDGEPFGRDGRFVV